MSMYGMTMRPMMMNDGSTTPACHGSKKTSISCRPRKYHGAFDGFGVRVGLAGSSSGASTSSDHTRSSTTMRMAHRNSARTRLGQVCTLSSPGPLAFLIDTSTRRAGGRPASAAPPATALNVALLSSAMGPRSRQPVQQPDDQRHQNGKRQYPHLELRAAARRSDRWPGESVTPDAPEMHRHEQAGDQWNEDAVQNVESQQGMRADLATTEQEGARVVNGIHADQLVERTFVSQQRGGTTHVRAHGHCPDRQLIPRQQVPGETEEQREDQQDDTDDPVEFAGRLVGTGQEYAEHVQPDGDHH